MKMIRECTRTNSQLGEPSTGPPRSDAAHQLRFLLIEFFIALTSGVLIWLWFLLKGFAFVCFDFVFEASAFAETSNSALTITCASAFTATKLAAVPNLEAGTTPPTELATEPSKITFAIKFNLLILRYLDYRPCRHARSF
jgi:hypothetical protein